MNRIALAIGGVLLLLGAAVLYAFPYMGGKTDAGTQLIIRPLGLVYTFALIGVGALIAAALNFDKQEDDFAERLKNIPYADTQKGEKPAQKPEPDSGE
jgi:hypothetical protein